MTIDFYKVPDDPRQIPKTLENKVTRTGALRGEADVLNPNFEVTSTVPLDVNYCYIPEFNRYYFCKVEVIRTGLYRVSCKVDVLQTYYPEFIGISCIVKRSTNVFNAYIPDERRKFYQQTFPQYIDIGDVGKPTKLLIVTVG